MSGIEALKSNLDAYIKRYYLIRLLRGLLLWLGLSILLFILWSTLEYFNRFSSGTRAFLFWSYLSLFGAWLFFLVALPLFRMLRLIRTFDYREAAVKIGRRLKGLDEHLLDTLSFSEQRENSDLLIQALEQKALRFQNISFKSLIKLSELRRLASLSSIPIVLMVVLLSLEQGRDILDSSERLVYYQEEFVEEAPFTFILPEEQSIVSGESLNLEFSIEGDQLPSDLIIELNGTDRLPVKTGIGQWTLRIDNAQEDFNIRAVASGFYSAYREFKVLEKPLIKGVQIRVNPPLYTGLDSWKSGLKSIERIPEGSEIKLVLNNPENLSSASFSSSLGDFSFIDDQLDLILLEDISYTLSLENEFTAVSLYEGNGFRLIRDQTPSIEVLDIDTLSDDAFVFRLAVDDDYGFSGLERVFNSEQGDSLTPMSFTPNAVLIDTIKLGSLGEGRSYTLSYRVWDNDQVNGFKSANTIKVDLYRTSKEEKEKESLESLKGVAKSSQERQQEVEELNDRLESLGVDLLESKSMSFSLKQELSQELEALKKRNQEIQAEREETKKLLEDLQDSEEKQELTERLEEMDERESELAKLEEEIRDLMEKLNLNELREKLDELKRENQEQLRREERTEDLLEDLIFQRDLLNQANKLQDLSDQMKEQGEKDDLDLEEGQKVQEELSEIMEKLEEMSENKKELEDLLKSEEFKQSQEEAQESLQESQDQKQQGDSQKANSAEKKSSESMQEMRESLTSMMSAMQAQAMSMNMESLRRLLENLEVFSQDVEAVGENIGALGDNDPRFKLNLLEQGRLLEGSKVIEDSLRVLAERAPQLSEKVFDELSKMVLNLNSARVNLQELRIDRAVVGHQYSMMAANELALLLDQSLQNMMAMMASQQEGQQNCEKPGGSKPKPGQMAKQMSQLGEKVDRLQKGNKKGKGEGFSQDMAEIMAQQEAMREMISEMESEENRPAGGNGDKESELLEELDKLEDDLLEQNFDDYLERVKRIETRLLKDERAEEQREQKEQRQAEQGDNLDMKNGNQTDLSSKRAKRDSYKRSRLSLLPFYELLIDGE